MILIYIENKEILTKIITYIENAGLSYTTDLNVEYEYLFIAELSNKVINLVNEAYENNKKIIFNTILEEINILKKNELVNQNSKNYFNKLINILDKCEKIIVSLPIYKKLLKEKTSSEIVIIGKEIPIINISRSNNDIYEKYKISKRKRKITIIDLDYDNLEIINNLSLKYKKYNFVYVGFKPDFLLKEKEKEILYKLPKNVTRVKYFNFNILSDICKISYIIINFENLKLDIKYLYMIMLFKKQFLIKESPLFYNYLINSKNCYIFKDEKELNLRFNKIIEGRVGNLTEKAYDLVKDSNFYEIVKKYSFYIR